MNPPKRVTANKSEPSFLILNPVSRPEELKVKRPPNNLQKQRTQIN